MDTPILLIAGEKSGEEHALTFIKDIQSNTEKKINFFGVGGEELKAEGVDLLYHIKNFSFFGFSGILKQYPYYKKAFEHLLREVDQRKCKNAILIDFQGFNLKLATELHKRGVRVFYYVAPQAWAWKAWRAKTLSRVTYALFTIIDFEKKWFTERGVKNVISVSHPVYQKYKNELPEKFDDRDEVLFLPGSRNAEVKQLLPIFAKLASELKKNNSAKTSIVITSSVSKNFYDLYLENFDVVYQSEELSKAMKKASFSFAASGTVTLSLALFQVPSIVCYKVTLFNEFIIKTLIKFKGDVSLANIIHQKTVFPEFLQDSIQISSLLECYKRMIHPECYTQVMNILKETKKLLAGEEDDVGKYIAQHLK